MLSVQLAAALTLVGLPAGSAPTVVDPVDANNDPTNCWSAVALRKAESTALWMAGDAPGALTARLDVLDRAKNCGQLNPEQQTAIANTFENVFRQVADGLRLETSRAYEVHRLYRDFTRDHEPSPQSVRAYEDFCAVAPPKATPPITTEPITPVAPQPVTTVELKPDVLKPANGKVLRIGGPVALVTAAGSLVAGILSFRAMAREQEQLGQLCPYGCDTKVTEAQRTVARGQVYEIAGPVLLGTGIALAIAGGIMLGLGLKRNATRSSMSPVLSPRFAGLSWALRF